jgi:hypothetical protein
MRMRGTQSLGTPETVERDNGGGREPEGGLVKKYAGNRQPICGI